MPITHAAPGVISLRHYSISVAPSGLRKSLKALLGRKELPDLGGLRDVSEFVTKSGYGSVGGLVLVEGCWGTTFDDVWGARDCWVQGRARAARRRKHTVLCCADFVFPGPCLHTYWGAPSRAA